MPHSTPHAPVTTAHVDGLAASAGAAPAHHTARRRLRRALMEAGVVLSLTFAIVAVLCLFGLQRASAMEISTLPDAEGRVAIGALLLAGFVGLCGLTTFMLRDTLGEPRRIEAPRSRRG
ncbi:hypothetical protein [Ancylobacter radicis]|uniref:hypothetical protein n=1 Tax=Ancylobacter radicis TaxID=2836179 RepID=UPI002022D253|nr:hypothetical protein [Ancylobacter radicis]